MGVSEKPGLLDNRLWAGKAFDGGWTTSLNAARDVTEPATGQVLGRVGIASAADMQAAITRGRSAWRPTASWCTNRWPMPSCSAWWARPRTCPWATVPAARWPWGR